MSMDTWRDGNVDRPRLRRCLMPGHGDLLTLDQFDAIDPFICRRCKGPTTQRMSDKIFDMIDERLEEGPQNLAWKLTPLFVVTVLAIAALIAKGCFGDEGGVLHVAPTAVSALF